jgi:5'-phosphate synthase pdxT subunit
LTLNSKKEDGNLLIGVLGFQGDFYEHVEMLKKMKIDTIVVRKTDDFEKIDGLIIPGGESTTMIKIMKETGMDKTLETYINKGLPTFGTCAGMIVLSKSVSSYNQFALGTIDMEVERNAYGRQVESFESDLIIEGFDSPYKAIFIRAPRIMRVGREVSVMAELNGTPVLVRQGSAMAASFHPELTTDTRVHQLFLEMVREKSGG